MRWYGNHCGTKLNINQFLIQCVNWKYETDTLCDFRFNSVQVSWCFWIRKGRLVHGLIEHFWIFSSQIFDGYYSFVDLICPFFFSKKRILFTKRSTTQKIHLRNEFRMILSLIQLMNYSEKTQKRYNVIFFIHNSEIKFTEMEWYNRRTQDLSNKLFPLFFICYMSKKKQTFTSKTSRHVNEWLNVIC